jgi:hypothetical protein
MRRGIDLAKRLTMLAVPGVKVSADALTTGSSVSLGTGQACEVTLAFIDPDGALCASGRVDRGKPLTWAGLPFTIARVEHAASSGVRLTTVVGRSAGWQHLRRRRGPRTWLAMSATQVVTAEARAVGLTVVGEATAVRKSITRTTENGKAASKVTTLDMIERLARESGFVFGEVGGVFYFGRPTWLAARAGRAVKATAEYLTDYPRCAVTDDDLDQRATISLSVLGDDPSEKLLPFTPVQLSGVPGMFEGRYLINRVTIPLDRAEAGTVDLVTPVDPEKQKTA